MPDFLLLTFFRTCRKLTTGWSLARHKFKMASYYRLSGKRFKIHPSFKTGKRFSIESDLSQTNIDIKENGKARNDFYIRMGYNGKLYIGRNCFFNNRCSITCIGLIEIGDNNQFGENVLIYDHNHKFDQPDKLISEQGFKIGSIKIGNNCWIGSNVVILKDVEIGDNVVIGAGTVVYKSIASNSVVHNHQNL